MSDVLVLGYMLGWVLTTVGLIVSSRYLMTRRRPAPHPVAVSVLAGAVWPLLLLGFVEFGALAATAKVVEEHEPGMHVVA